MLTGSRSNLLALLTAVVHGVLLLQQFLVPSVCGYYLPALLRPGSVGVPHPGTPGAPPARIRGSAADPTAAPFGYGMAPDGSGVIALKSPRTPDGRGRLWNIDRRASVNGAGVFNGTDTGAGRGYIRLPLQREVVNTTGWPNETHPSIARRWGWSRLEDFRGIVYLIELQIGDPPQPIKVLIDTGSFELWVNPTCANTVDARFCESLGRYNPRRSSTAKLIDGSEFLLYYYGGWAQGQYYLDKLHIAMNTVPELQFGVSNISDRIWAGILGLGYGYPWNTDYLTVLDNIWLYGFVDSPIFSIGIGGVGDGFSEIVFGGVNVFKFAGPLEPLPLDPPPGEQKRGWVHYWINVTSIGVTRPGERPIMFTNPEHFNMRVLIDTGSTLSWVWPEVARIIAEQFNATYDEQHKTYYVDCAYKDLSGTVDWGFNRGNLVVQVRYKDFIHEPAPGYCKLGVQPTEGPLYILGDTFIRGAYLVFDQPSNTVWMAGYYNCGNGIYLVGKEKGDVARARGMC